MELILIVDNDALNRDLMALVVRSQGWEPLAAADGVQALDHASAASAILVGDARTRPEHFEPSLLSTFKSSLGEFRDIFETLRG
jgi:CheY-like chemotaxis protein